MEQAMQRVEWAIIFQGIMKEDKDSLNSSAKIKLHKVSILITGITNHLMAL